MMEATMVSLYRDYKHGKRLRSQPHSTAHVTNNNVRTMPTLPRSKLKQTRQRGESFHQVEVSRQVLCTTTPPPSLISPSLPRIRHHGNAAQQRHRHSHSYSNHLPAPDDKGLFMPSIQYRTTQSLPSLSQSKLSGKSSKKGLYRKDPQKCSTFDLFKTSRLGRRTASNRQNFAWDFSQRDDKVPSVDMPDNSCPKCSDTDRDKQSSRPVHLYMSVEMMDRLLEKRKGLRTDATLNELIGLPPSIKAVSDNSPDKKIPFQHSPIVKKVRMKDEETSAAERAPSILKGPQSDKPQDDVNMDETESKDETASEKKVTVEDLLDNEMECEFGDEEDVELGGLGVDEGAEVFDSDEDEEGEQVAGEEFDEEEDEVCDDTDEDADEELSGQDEEEEEEELSDEAVEEDGEGKEVDEQEDNISDEEIDEDLAGHDEDDDGEQFEATEEEGEEDEEEEGEGEGFDEEDNDISDEEADEALEEKDEGPELSDDEQDVGSDRQDEASDDDDELISDEDENQ